MKTSTLIKYLSGDASQKERLAVLDWVEEDEAHRSELMDLHVLYDALLLDGNMSEADFRQRIRQKRPGRVVYALLSLAAAVALVLGIWKFMAAPEPDIPWTAQTLCSPVGQQTETILSDGTLVHLNSGSTLELLGLVRGERHVRLDGEAFFDVAHDAAHPFIIETEHLEVRVLGTVFNVNTYDATPSVVLVEGRVEVSDNGREGSTILSPGQMYRLDTRTGERTVSQVDPDHFVSWTRGFLQFQDAPLSWIFTQLENYFKVSIHCASDKKESLPVTGKLELRMGIEVALDNLDMLVPLSWSREGDRLEVEIQ